MAKGYGNKHGETYRGQPFNVRQLLTEQRLKTREDTIAEVISIYEIAKSMKYLNPDHVFVEMDRCFQSLKPKPHA
jgi:hypothetical protein